MKELALLVCVLFVVTLSFPSSSKAQGTVEKVTAEQIEKEKQENLELQKKLQEEQLKKQQLKEQILEVETESDDVVTIVKKSETKKTLRNIVKKDNLFPENWFNVYGGAIQMKSADITYENLNFKASISQEQKNNRARWGMGIWGGAGRFLLHDQLNPFEGRIKSYGAFISLISTTQKRNMSRAEINLGIVQQTVTGSVGDYSEKQVDRMLRIDFYLNLTRDKDRTFFVSSDFSLSYNYNLWSEKSAQVGKYAVKTELYNPKYLYAEYNQGLMLFNLTDVYTRTQLLTGFTVLYLHQSQDKRDSYGGLIWIKLMYNFQDVLSLHYGGQTCSGIPVYEIIKINLNLVNGFKMFL